MHHDSLVEQNSAGYLTIISIFSDCSLISPTIVNTISGFEN